MTLSSAMGAGRAASAAIFSGEHSSDRAALAPAISEVRLTDEQIPVSLCLAGGHSSVKTEPIAPAPPWAEITQRLVAELEPDRIILFGSHAWGDPDEDSDLDLLVIVPHSEQPPTQRAVRAHRCLRDIPFPLDVLVKTRAEVERGSRVPASLISEILERGKVLYG